MKELIELFAEKVGRYPRGNVQDELRSWAANEITTLRQQLAKSEARVAELEEGLRGITQYPDVREYVGTICHDAALSALKGSDGAWLLRKQAEAVEAFVEPYYRTPFTRGIVMDGQEYAQRLRQQAAEAERAGGEK